MLKIIAFLTMLIDHTGYVFYPGELNLRIIGRIAFPIFAFGIAMGYVYTKNWKTYMARLFLLALISQVPYYFLFQTANLNIGFTLLLGLLAIVLYDKYHENNFGLMSLLLIVIMFVATYFKMEYKFYGVLLILVFYLTRGYAAQMFYAVTLLTVFSIPILNYNPIQIYAIAAVPFIVLLQKYHIAIPRVVTYSFYPVHLFILLLLK